MDPSKIVAKVVGRGPRVRTEKVTGDLSGGRYEPPPDAGVIFDGAILRGVDLSGTRFSYFSTRSSRFTDCDFSGSRLEGTFGTGSVFEGCSFAKVSLLDMRPGRTRFEACSFAGTRMKGWVAPCDEYVNCQFSGRIERAKFFGRPIGVCAEHTSRKKNEFRGNDFRHADLIDTNFAFGIDLDAQQWPESGDYIIVRDVAHRMAQAREAVSAWTSETERRDAMIMLDAYARSSPEQDNVFARKDDAAGQIPANVRERVWSLLLGST